MKTFKDNEGREWSVSINVGTIKRVRGMLNVDLLTVVDGKSDLMSQLMTDPILLVDVIYVLCKPQADDRNISDEKFGEAMAGDAIEAATDALIGELIDFFPEAKRAVFQMAVNKTKKTQSMAIQRATEWIQSGELDRQIEDELNKALPLSGS